MIGTRHGKNKSESKSKSQTTLTTWALLAGAMLLAIAMGACGNSGNKSKSAGSGAPSVCGMEFSATEFCAQAGTAGQATKCAAVTAGGTTCKDPEIRYGTTEGGIPGDLDPFVPNVSDLNTWCVQLGFSSYQAGSVTFGNRACLAPKGKLFACSPGTAGDTDDPGIWHWCDSENTNWKSATLDSHVCSVPGSVPDRITSITCTP